MAMAYVAGSKVPTSAELTTILAQTVGACTPNEIRIIEYALSAKPMIRTGPANEQTVSSILP